MRTMTLLASVAFLAAGCGGGDVGAGGTGGNSSAGSGGSSGTGASTGSGGGTGDGGSAGSTSNGGAGGEGDDASVGSGGSGSGDDAGQGGAGGSSPTGFAVVTNRYDNERTGVNPTETILNTTNVATPGKFGLLFSRLYDGNAYAQPLYVGGLDIGGGKHNVVFVATSTNHVYAFDADDPGAMDPYWAKQVSPAATVTIGGSGGQVNPQGTTWCKDMYPFSGVTGTPVIDLATRRMYLVTQEGNPTAHYQMKVHALDLVTGDEVGGGPVVIDATVDGTGAGSVGGKLKFDPWRQFNRAGLTLYKGVLYIGMTSHCDEKPYHGWVFAYDAATLAQKSVFNTSPNKSGASIWQSGSGMAANDKGIFFCTSNGDVTPDGAALGVSIVRLNLDNTLGDWFSPSEPSLHTSDADLVGGPVLLPGTNYVVAGGKNGTLYLMDQGNMTHFNAGGDKIVQSFKADGMLHNIVFYDNQMYLWPTGAPLKAYPFANGKFDTGAVKTFGGYTPSHPGGIMTISSNGTTPGSAIVWAAVLRLGDAWHNIAKGALVALDAKDVKNLLFDSTKNSGDDLGNLAKFSPPTVANGKVYVTTFANVNATSPSYLRVYGLKN
jgi:hypothetical protein